MKRKQLIILALCLLTFGGFISYSFKNHHSASSPFIIENKKSRSGYSYTIFYKNNLLMDVTLKRPDKNDKNILICIPAAYTDLQTYFVDGLYIDNGKVYNKDKVNHSLGGAIKIINGNCEIFPTQKGKLLNDSLINFITSKKGSLFQQIQTL
jgi:hypothetical protein